MLDRILESTQSLNGFEQLRDWAFRHGRMGNPNKFYLVDELVNERVYFKPVSVYT